GRLDQESDASESVIREARHAFDSRVSHWLVRGTRTVTAEIDSFPDGSVHATVIVYTRPVPLPDRSARRFTVRSPVITQSGLVSPSPSPSTGSLLVTDTIRHDTVAPQPSDAVT